MSRFALLALHGFGALFLAVAAPVAPAQPLVTQGLECRGDDATWRVDAGRAAAQYSATAPRKRDVVFRGGLQAVPTTPPMLVWRGDTTHLPRETLVLSLREGACRAGDPATPGTHVALLSIRPGEAVTGCCTVRAGYDARVAPVANLAAKPAEDWARRAAEFLPALNACTSRAGGRLKVVQWVRSQGPNVRVRLQETGGNIVDCTVDAAGRNPPLFSPADNEAVPPGSPWWYPARDPAPVVACGRLERVQNARGATAGYLQYDPC